MKFFFIHYGLWIYEIQYNVIYNKNKLKLKKKELKKVSKIKEY